MVISPSEKIFGVLDSSDAFRIAIQASQPSPLGSGGIQGG